MGHCNPEVMTSMVSTILVSNIYLSVQNSDTLYIVAVLLQLNPQIQSSHKATKYGQYFNQAIPQNHKFQAMEPKGDLQLMVLPCNDHYTYGILYNTDLDPYHTKVMTDDVGDSTILQGHFTIPDLCFATIGWMIPLGLGLGLVHWTQPGNEHRYI